MPMVKMMDVKVKKPYIETCFAWRWSRQKLLEIIWREKKGVFLEVVRDWTLLRIFSKEFLFWVNYTLNNYNTIFVWGYKY